MKKIEPHKFVKSKDYPKACRICQYMEKSNIHIAQPTPEVVNKDNLVVSKLSSETKQGCICHCHAVKHNCSDFEVNPKSCLHCLPKGECKCPKSHYAFCPQSKVLDKPKDFINQEIEFTSQPKSESWEREY